MTLSESVARLLNPKPVGVAGPSSPRVSGVSDEAITPVPESVEGVNFDWRGQEQHGVPVTNGSTHPQDPRTAFMHTVDAEHVEHPHPVTPVLVKVVHEDGQETRAWRVINTAATGAPSMILNRMDTRTKLSLFNLGAATVFINCDNGVSPINGYPILANTGIPFEMETQSAVWAVSADGTTCDVRALIEFTKDKR